MAAIISMLQLNNRDAASQLLEQDNDGDDGAIVNPSLSEPIWKVLIYDQAGQEIISPLLKVNELRENGITVHMHLNSERLPIPDVPAIYFVQPTIETLKRIGEDLSRKLYDSYYLNFTYTIPRAILEELAAIAISSNGSNLIAQVYDQYMSFTCLENRLFTFSMSDSYRILNDPTSTDSAIDAFTDKIVNSLFSVLATLGVVPIIKSPRRGAAANIASKLDQRLRSHLIDTRNNLFSSEANASGTRPVLLLLDRSFDISTMLLHSWTYASLVHDILDMKLDESGKKIKKVYDVDVSDYFWARNSGNPFQQVAGIFDVLATLQA
ncbi:Vesicle trafficking between the ER and Golgi [Cladochytrium tenue]|nr:Vesicle trafficking between the ER and Golgi [Cladochytrium tenue]